MYEELVKLFNQFESQECLFDLKVNEVYIWEYIRGLLFSKISNEKMHYSIEKIKKPKKNSLIKKILLLPKKIVFYYFLGNPFFVKRKDLLIINIDRKILFKKKFRCIYTYDLQQKIPFSFYTLDYYKDKNEYFTNKKYFNAFRIWDKKVYINIPKNDITNIEKIIAKVNKTFKMNTLIDINSVLNQIKQILLFREKYKKSFEKFIKKVNPKAILYISNTRIENKVITEIAKNMRIPTIELQHGMIFKGHLAYNFPLKETLHYYPDHLFIFGDIWRKGLTLPIPNKNIWATGFPFFESQKKQFKANFTKPDKVYILFISDMLVSKKLSSLAYELIESLDKNKYKIIYKLHPDEIKKQNWREIYPKLIHDNIQVIDSLDQSLYYFFSISDYLVGVFSTALFEGLGFGLPTFIYKMEGYKASKLLYEDAGAFLVSKAKEIIEHLEKNPKNIYLQDLWKENSTESMIKSISKIINKRQ